MSTQEKDAAAAGGSEAAHGHGPDSAGGHGHDSAHGNSEIAVEPDRLPTRMLGIWVVVTSLFVVGLVVGVVQLFDRWGSKELDSKLSSEPTQLDTIRNTDEARMGQIETAMARLVADPSLLGPLALPGDEEGSGAGTGEPAPTEGSVPPAVPPTPTNLAEAAAATPPGLTTEGTGQTAAVTPPVAPSPEGTGQTAAVPSTPAPTEGTGQAAVREGTGQTSAVEGTGQTAAVEGTGQTAAVEGTGQAVPEGTGQRIPEGTGTRIP